MWRQLSSPQTLNLMACTAAAQCQAGTRGCTAQYSCECVESERQSQQLVWLPNVYVRKCRGAQRVTPLKQR